MALLVLAHVPSRGHGKPWFDIVQAAPRTAGNCVISRRWGIDPLLRAGWAREIEQPRRPNGTRPFALIEITRKGKLAIAIEARRAATLGAVHESAGPTAIADTLSHTKQEGGEHG